MSRLIRIALTFFASATVLIVLLRQRAVRLSESIEAGIADESAREEGRMILMGLILAGGLAVGGFALIIVAIMKKRRESISDHGG